LEYNMNARNLFISLVLLVGLIVLTSPAMFAQTRYLNSTDGDDSYTGVNAINDPLGSGPKKTIEGAYAAFPDNAIVYMKAGEYHYNQSASIDANGIHGGNDDDGVQIKGTKNMTFIIETYNSSPIVYLCGTTAGADSINCPGKTIKFQGANAATQSVSINDGPAIPTYTATNAIVLTAGTLDVSGLLSFDVGPTVDTMTRVAGSVVGNFTYDTTATRVMHYTGITAQSTGGELQTELREGTLRIDKTLGALSIGQNLTATTGGAIENINVAAATISGMVTIAGDVGAPSTISLTNTGALTLSNTVTISSKSETWGTFIDKDGTGNLVISGALNINSGITGTDLDGGGAAFTAFGGGTNIIRNNSATGKLTLSGLITFNKTGTAYPYVLLTNTAAGTIEIGNSSGTGSVLYGTIENDIAGAKVNLIGNLTMKQNTGGLAGSISNNTGTSTIALGANTLTIATNLAPVVAGIRNAGTISSTSTGLLSFAHTVADQKVTGIGPLPNIATSLLRGVDASETTTINGNITVNATADTLKLSAVTSLTGNISLVGGQRVELGGAIAIGGNVTLTLGNLVMDNDATIAGNLTLSGGTFTMGGDVTLSGNYVQNSGTLDFNGYILICQQSFTRTTGTVTNTAGSKLQFSSGGGGQVFSGGPNLSLYDLAITGTGTGVTLTNGSVEIVHDCSIDANTSLQLGTLNISMVGLGGTITNGGQIYSSGLGSVIFSGPDDGGGLGTAGSVSTIGGTGKYSNIEIRLTDPKDYVTCANNVVSWTGRLAFTSGGIDNSTNAFAKLNPIDGVASMVINMTLNAGRPFGTGPYSPFDDAGRFDVLSVLYDLTYVGNITTGVLVAGNEYKTPLVRNLTVQTIGAAGNYVEFGADYTMVGNLTIPALSQLNLNGGALTASSATGVHVVAGLLSSTAATDQLILTGAGTLTGSSTLADSATIENLTVNAPANTYAITNMQQIGKTATAFDLDVIDGTVNLGMYQTAVPAPSAIFNFTQSGGTVVLTNNAMISTGSAASTFNISGGTFDLANYNLWFSNAQTFTATGGTFLITGATTGGYLQFRTTGATINSGTVAVPRVSVNTAATAGAWTLTLGGNSVIGDIFTHSVATSTFAMGANTLTLAGTGTTNTWNTKGLYTGTGKILVTGPVTANLAANTEIPNLEVDNTTGTFTLVDNDAVSTTVPDLTVTTLFTMTSGKIDLLLSDLILTRTGANALSYAAGTISATTGTAVPLTDITYGEVIFNGTVASLSAVSGLVIPNLTVNSATSFTLTTNTVPFTVSKYFVMNTPSQVYTTAGNLIIGDNAWIEVKSASTTLDIAPAFGTNVNYCYNQGNNLTTSLELTSSATAIQKFYNSPGGGYTTTLNAATTVNNELRLINGDLKTTATKTMTMGVNSLVTRVGGTLNVLKTASANLLGGPIDLTYLNTVSDTTRDGEFPSTMTVDTLTVSTNIHEPSSYDDPAPLVLHADRSCGDFVLVTDGATTPQSGTQFDLNGFTLAVTHTPTATLTRGALVSYKATAGVYVYGRLTVTGMLTQAAAASIKNVIVTVGTNATLAGSFGTQDYEGTLDVPNVSATLPTMTVAGNASVAGFNGDLTVTGNTTINGAYTGGSLIAGGNVTVTTSGSMTPFTNLTFIGSAGAILTVPSAGATVGSITFNKTTGLPIDTVRLAGGNLSATGIVNFINGLFIVPAPLIFNIPAPTLGYGQGFTRVVAAADISHVIGSVSKTLRNTGSLSSSTEPTSIFPVGTGFVYRPATLTFNPAFGVPTTPNATIVVNHVDSNPGGFQKLPIPDGVETGVDVSRYPSFYWSIYTVDYISQSTVFDLGLTAGNFTDYDSPANVRIIRRHGAVGDITNDWLLQGVNTNYDNEVNTVTGFTAINRNSVGGLRQSPGAVFTFGMKSNIVAPVFPDITIGKVGGVYSPNPYKLALAGKFSNGVGTYTYTATSTNPAVATVTVVHDTLRVTPIADGDAIVTVKATDANNDFVTVPFNVRLRSTGVDVAVELPKEFSLKQNYPNPFNPTTNISFDIPQNSSVKIAIYDMLGREVAVLVNANHTPGKYTVPFNASKLASGMYIYRMTSQSLSGDQKMFTSTKKLVLVK
jgi:hypothetical protein